MGESLGLALEASAHEVFWCRQGRSAATHARAQTFAALDTLKEVARSCEGCLSVCPPGEALTQARAVAQSGFVGVYVDANAVAPATAAAIAALFPAHYVDGGIVGPPARVPGTTRLYLSGERSAEVAGWFKAGPLEALDLGTGSTRASALKMAYAAYTKGLSALLLNVNALAERTGVRDALLGEWERSQPGLAARSDGTAAATSRKAWRFVGEMAEIAATFRDAGLPDGFHEGAGEVYARMAILKDQPAAELDRVLQALLDGSDAGNDDDEPAR